MMNAKLSLHGFWHCQEKGNQDDTPQPISEFQVGLPLLCKRLILVYPNTRRPNPNKYWDYVFYNYSTGKALIKKIST